MRLRGKSSWLQIPKYWPSFQSNEWRLVAVIAVVADPELPAPAERCPSRVSVAEAEAGFSVAESAPARYSAPAGYSPAGFPPAGFSPAGFSPAGFSPGFSPAVSWTAELDPESAVPGPEPIRGSTVLAKLASAALVPVGSVPR